MLTQKYVHWLFNYHAASGVLTWRVQPAHSVPRGTRAGSHSTWCRHVQIDGKKYREADIIWLWMTGVWPTVELDHADCNAFDNSWSNLREATRNENKANRRNYRPGKLKWTCLMPSGVYQARVCFRGVHHHVGSYPTEQEAHDAAYALAQRLHGAFVRE